MKNRILPKKKEEEEEEFASFVCFTCVPFTEEIFY